MGMVVIAATKIDDKVELFVDIYGCERDDPRLTACRINFEESKRELFATDTVGSGLLTLTMDQAQELNDQLTAILSKLTKGEG